MSLQAINLIPFWSDLKAYRFPSLRADLIAGLSVALLALPQAMAYAFLAGLPPSAGIWSAVFGTIFTASFGHSRFLVSGPTNAVAILIQSGTSEILYNFYRQVSEVDREAVALSIVLQLVLLIGIFHILGALFRLGRLVQFTSRSVVVGYTTGVAIAIVISQLFPFFGILNIEGYRPLYYQAWYLIANLNKIHWATTFLAIGCLVLLVAFYRQSKKIPAAAIVLTLATAIVAFFNLAPASKKSIDELSAGEREEKVALLKDIGPVFTEYPSFDIPSFDVQIVPKLIPLALAIAFLSMLEVTAIGRAYSSAKEPPYQDNQEVYGLGVSNVLSSCLGAMPSSGSFSRSELNAVSGGKTRFAAIFSGLFVFLFTISLGFLVGKIPIAALSALMLLTAYTMVNLRNLVICLKTTHADAFVVLVTVFSSLIFTLDVALFVGIVLSIALYLKQAAVPSLVEYSFNNIGKLRPLELEDERLDPRVCILQVEGELFFGAADQLQMMLRQVGEEEHLKVVILQLLHTRHLDASVCMALHHIYAYLKNTGRYLLLSGVAQEALLALKQSGLLEEVGEAHVFLANEQVPSEPTRKAYAYAKNLLVA